ncbi:glycosyltransferase family 39 protein [Candidatus Gottesmanbacteria bacterium]|nr:glycosyltransferase family 39 protein [Candidatus Gottesmanbacteria bacterium]
MKRDIGWIINVFLLASLLLYGYYCLFTPHGMSYVYRNWDGPGYLIVAKTLYNVDLINKINPFPFLAATHYAFQFPGYPLVIRLFSFIGWNESMIFSSQLFALLFSIALYILVKEVIPKANALVVAILSIFYTPRWFIVSHVGSTEPQMMFFITLFMILFHRKKYFWAGLAMGLAQLTKPQGIVFFIGIGLYYLYQMTIARNISLIRSIKEIAPFLFIPLALVSVFTAYYFQYGNFWLFLSNGAFPTMQLPPLKVLVATSIMGFPLGFWTGWLEFVIYNYVLYLGGIVLLFEKKLHFFGVIALIYFCSVLTFVQADMARFILPIMPFVYLGYAELLSQKAVYRTLFLSLPMVFLFAVGYINYNLAPL